MTQKRTTATILLAAALALLSLLAVAPLAQAQDSAIDVRRGTVGDGQTAAALTTQDQSGADDDWGNYVEFLPDSRRHLSYLNLPATGTGDVLTMDLNFRGPEWSDSRWVMHLFDYDTDKWVRVFRSRHVEDFTWTAYEAELDDGSRFVEDGSVRVRYKSGRDADPSQLDLLQFSFEDEAPPTGDIILPPEGAAFDYQIGGDYPLPAGVTVVSRDWHIGQPAAGAYSICYVNAFQTQPDEDGPDRIDATSNWPANVVLTSLADDPNWSGEYLIDISSSAKRSQAASWVSTMVDTCASKGFDAVEFDNLDSWTRFDGIAGLADQVPFGQAQAAGYATLITEHAHSRGLAVAQKNTTQMIFSGRYEQIGFDFAIAEQCAVYSECGDFIAGYGNAVIAIEYDRDAFADACQGYGGQLSIVLRDVGVSTPGNSDYIFDTCSAA